MVRARRIATLLSLVVLAVLVPDIPGRAAAGEPVCEEVLIDVGDGVELYGWVHRPAAAGQFPVSWTMTPYGAQPCSPSIMGEDIAQVTVHIRGTGASDGALDGYGRIDQEDFRRRVPDWIVAQPWSDGRILAVGGSATAYWIPWALAHPNVVVGLQQTSCVDGYRGCLRPGGGMVGGTLILTQGVLEGYAENIPTRVRLGQDVSGVEQTEAAVSALADQWARDTYDEFWQERSALEAIATNTTPVMYTTDLYDYVPWSMYEGYLFTPGARLNTGIGHNDFDPAQGDLDALTRGPARRFARHHLLGEGGGAPGDPPVTLVTNLGSVAGYQAGHVLVRGEREWPVKHTEWTRLHLDGARSGSATSLNDGSLILTSGDAQDAVAPVVSAVGPKSELRALLQAAKQANRGSGRTMVDYDAIGDLRAEEARALTFTTPVLGEDVEITGPITLRLVATSTTPNLEWSVRLTDVWPDGSSQWITDGQLRGSLRQVDDVRSLKTRDGDVWWPWHTFAAHEPVPVGEATEYLIQLAPTSNVFRAGHRIRLDITPVLTSSFDGARTAGAGAVVVHAGGGDAGSSLLVPVVPNRCHKGSPGVDGVERPSPCVSLGSALGGSS